MIAQVAVAAKWHVHERHEALDARTRQNQLTEQGARGLEAQQIVDQHAHFEPLASALDQGPADGTPSVIIR